MASPVELFLTCGSWQEAQAIADSLLEQKLVACVEFFDVKSKYHWQGALEEAKEIKLVMHSVAELYDKVEVEVRKLHSYDTFVLLSMPVERLPKAAEIWISETLA